MNSTATRKTQPAQPPPVLPPPPPPLRLEDCERLTETVTIAVPHVRTTLQGRTWLTAGVAGVEGLELLVFPNTYKRIGHLFTDGARLEVTGLADRSHDWHADLFIVQSATALVAARTATATR